MNVKTLIQQAVEASVGGNQQAAADLIKQSIQAKARALVAESRPGDEDYHPGDYTDDSDPFEEICRADGCVSPADLPDAFEEALFFHIPLKRFSSEEAVIRKAGIKIVNDTGSQDFLQAIRAAYAPLDQFLANCDANGEWINSNQVDTNALYALFGSAYVEQPVGQDDYYSITKLAQIMPQVVELINRGTFCYADARQDWADGEAEQADPYGYRGLRRSDF